MNNDLKINLTRIGVFYDGNYLLHVSNYYNYVHERRSRISIRGIHEFIRHQISNLEQNDVRLCQIVDSHYFKGRLTASEASQRGDLLFYERVFDDILMNEGVTTHYLPVKNVQGRKQEKGIDVWFALEAFELAFYKRFNVLVLIAADGDYVPLIRKLNTLGTRVMVLSWDFEYTDEDGNRYSTRTSQDLLEEVTYPVAMHEIIENRVRKNESLINNLFVPRSKEKIFNKLTSEELVKANDDLVKNDDEETAERKTSSIISLKEGFGFIKYPPNNVFFHYRNLIDYDFNDLLIGDKVQFSLEIKDNGHFIAKDVVVVE